METTNYQDVIDFLEEQKASCGIEENQYFEVAVNTLRKVDRLEAENDQLREAMRLNCLMCESMHENGNCTETGGVLHSYSGSPLPADSKTAR